MELNFEKYDGLIPAIIQDYASGRVLMLGFMNEEAYTKTVKEKRVTFFSRSKNRLWTKGETSGNFLAVKEIQIDCDSDTLLVYAEPAGPVCHTGSKSCFGGLPLGSLAFIADLEDQIEERRTKPTEQSYTSQLFREGLAKISQKVGEEATEVIVAALAQDRARLVSETADLVYHLLVLLREKGVRCNEVVAELQNR